MDLKLHKRKKGRIFVDQKRVFCVIIVKLFKTTLNLNIELRRERDEVMEKSAMAVRG